MPADSADENYTRLYGHLLLIIQTSQIDTRLRINRLNTHIKLCYELMLPRFVQNSTQHFLLSFPSTFFFFKSILNRKNTETSNFFYDYSKYILIEELNRFP